MDKVLPKDNRYTFVLKDIGCKKLRSDNPMVVIRAIVGKGEFKGKELSDRFYPDETRFSDLKWALETTKSFDNIKDLVVYMRSNSRMTAFSAEVDHKFSIKRGDEWTVEDEMDQDADKVVLLYNLSEFKYVYEDVSLKTKRQRKVTDHG